jgi:hypothetical protein
LRRAIAVFLFTSGFVHIPPIPAGGCASSGGVVDNGSVVLGTAGDDSIDCSGAPTGRFIIGSGGNDVIAGSLVAPDVVIPGDGVDTVRGGDGPGDLVSFASAPGPVVVSTSGAADDGYGNDESGSYDGVEDLLGSPFADALTGDGGPNVLRGSAGDDLLAGGGGSDILVGDDGMDVASFADASRGIQADLSTGIGRDGGTDVFVQIEGIQGSAFDDVLTGSDGEDLLVGGSGIDLIQGGPGADDLQGNRGPDTLVGGSGADALDGGRGTDACAEGRGGGTKNGCEASAYAEAEGVVLFQPSRDPIGVGFHESLFSSAIAMRPAGPIEVNANPARFSLPAAGDGLRYVVMASRGRAADATTSADIVVGSSSPVLSPVNGRVIMVRRYLLYCQAGDWQVVIAPDTRPDLMVMILHTKGITVREGDRVTAAVTQVGWSWVNDLPTAEENLYFPDQYPHVHIEVDRGPTVPVPGCL